VRVKYPYDRLLDFVKEKGYASKVTPKSGIGGQFDPNDNSLEYQAGDTETAVHESMHALQHNAPSRAREILYSLSEIPQDQRKDLAYPTHWSKDQRNFEDPALAGRKTFDTDSWLTPESKNIVKSTVRKQGDAVAAATPDDMVRSGLLNLSYKAGLFANAMREAQAYYALDKTITPESKERRRTLGLFLRDRGVPWDIVDSLLKAQ
jgi:hypothetical protein